MVPGFGRPMQLLKGKVDRFQGLAAVVIIFMCSACTGILIYRITFLLFVDGYG